MSDPLPHNPRLQRRRPTSEELDKAAEITPADVDAALDAWRKYAPAEARGILEAVSDDDE